MFCFSPARMAKLMKPLKTMERLSAAAKKAVGRVKAMLTKREGVAPLAYYKDGSEACQQVNEKYLSTNLSLFLTHIYLFIAEEEMKEDAEKALKAAEENIIKTFEASKCCNILCLLTHFTTF